MEMRDNTMGATHHVHFQARGRAHKVGSGRKHHAREHTKRLSASRMFNVPDEQMSEPPVTPKDERRYWH